MYIIYKLYIVHIVPSQIHLITSQTCVANWSNPPHMNWNTQHIIMKKKWAKTIVFEWDLTTNMPHGETDQKEKKLDLSHMPLKYIKMDHFTCLRKCGPTRGILDGLHFYISYDYNGVTWLLATK